VLNNSDGPLVVWDAMCDYEVWSTVRLCQSRVGRSGPNRAAAWADKEGGDSDSWQALVGEEAPRDWVRAILDMPYARAKQAVGYLYVNFIGGVG